MKTEDEIFEDYLLEVFKGQELSEKARNKVRESTVFALYAASISLQELHKVVGEKMINSYNILVSHLRGNK